MSNLPRYRELPEAPRGGRSGWRIFGAEDNVGLVNLLTPERVAAAAQLVRTGRMFPLDLPLGAISPALARYREEDTPMRPDGDGKPSRVDMRRARWTPAP